MTSNIGSYILLENSGTDGEIDEVIREKVMTELRRGFRPEFLNRVDDIVLFKPLTKDEVKKIVRLVIDALGKRLEERDIHIEITDAALDYVVANGWNPEYGARPVKRFVQKSIETEIAKQIVKGLISEGDRVRVDCDGVQLAISAHKARD
jgi:ATP-dependent Clp protease ATP-binding subunit ClpB